MVDLTLRVNPSIPLSPKGTRLTPLMPSNKENILFVPARPDYANILPPRPSEGWLEQPAWIGRSISIHLT